MKERTVVIKKFGEYCDNTWQRTDEISVYVDGVFVADGTFGGEPEDNYESRDFPMLEKLARRLGADVEVVQMRESTP